MKRLNGVLKENFGHDGFRAGQEELIQADLNGKNIVGVMPTSSGKSLCYQLPAALSESSRIVVSPLIALMRDQVASLNAKGISAVDLHSGNGASVLEGQMDRVKNGEFDLLYLSPERLKNQDLILAVGRMLEGASLDRLVVDEAHVISSWGLGFRPEYREISEFIEKLSIPAISAFTATASKMVLDDIKKSLKLDDPFEYIQSAFRENLKFSVEKIKGPRKKKQRLHKLVSESAENGAAVVYCSTRKDVEAVCKYLANKGVNARFYHGGVQDFEREIIEGEFMNDEIDVLVSTNAFGMGVDKPNIRLVVHYSIPGSVDAYLQESGRAGRDGEESKCVLFYDQSDESVQRFFGLQNSPSIGRVLGVYSLLQNKLARAKDLGGFKQFNLSSFAKQFAQYSKCKGQDVALLKTAINLLQEHGVLEVHGGGYVKDNLNFTAGSPVYRVLEETLGVRAQISRAQLGQIVAYANDASPSQELLIEMMEEELVIEE